MARDAKFVKDLSENTKATYFREILRVRNTLNIDWIQKYKDATGGNVNESDVENKLNDEILKWIFDDKTRRSDFNIDKKDALRFRSNKITETETENKREILNEIRGNIKVMTKNEIDDAIILLTARQKELKNEERRIFLIDKFKNISNEELEKMLKDNGIEIEDKEDK